MALAGACGLRLMKDDKEEGEGEEEEEGEKDWEVVSSPDEHFMEEEFLRGFNELASEIVIEAGMWIVCPEAKALQLASKLGQGVNLGRRLTRAGKVFVKVEESKVGRVIKRQVEKLGGRVVETVMEGVVEVTRKGLKQLGPLLRFKDLPAMKVLKIRQGNASALRRGRSDYWGKALGEIANMAARGDREADTNLKLVKQAGKKAQKYGGK